MAGSVILAARMARKCFRTIRKRRHGISRNFHPTDGLYLIGICKSSVWTPTIIITRLHAQTAPNRSEVSFFTKTELMQAVA